MQHVMHSSSVAEMESTLGKGQCTVSLCEVVIGPENRTKVKRVAGEGV